MAKWGKPGSDQYRRINREYQRRWRKRKPEAARNASLRHYYRNRRKLLDQGKARRDKHQTIINKAKDVPCADCGVKYPPYVMDFDHVRGQKEFQIGGSLHIGTARLLAEIDKCDVVCSNCHRGRTFRRGQQDGTGVETTGIEGAREFDKAGEVIGNEEGMRAF